MNPDEDGDIWYPFPTETLECPVESDIDLSKLLPQTNSKILIDGGHFIKKDTKERVRFFGTNVCFSLAFPSKDHSPLIARRMSQLGINVVRFHHMDHRYIWLDNTNSILDPSKLDLLHYFLYCLHENGIYANINLHVSRIYPEPEFTSQLQSKFHYGKCLDRFYPPFLIDQMQYSLNLLNSYNKYTKCKLADDPMILNIELNNETTMFDLLHQDKFEAIQNTVFETELHKQWIDWLIEKYGTFDDIFNEWDNPNDQIDYENDLLTQTNQGHQKDSNSNFSTENDIYLFSVPQPPQFFWSNQLHFSHFPIESSTFYTVEFEGKFDSQSDQTEASVSISFQECMPPYNGYAVRSSSVKLTSEFSKFTVVLESSDSIETENPESSIIFKIIIGTEIGEYSFKNIHVYKGRVLAPFYENEKTIENIQLPCVNKSSRRILSDFISFIDDTETKTQNKLIEFIRSSFPRSEFLIVDSQACFGNLYSYRREYFTSDFIDNHAYWEHPSFERGFDWHRSHFSIRNTPMFNSNNFGTFTHLTMMKPFNKPYTISEYNHPFPNEHLHEKFPMLGSWSAFHDFDAIYQFAFGNSEMNYIEDYFSMCSNPLDYAFAPFAAFAFRNFYVSTSSNFFHLKIPKDFQLKQCSQIIKPFYAGWPATFDIEFVDEQKDHEYNFDIDQKGHFETDEIIWTDKIYQVNSPKLRTITGFIGNSDKSIMNDMGILKVSLKLNENLNESASIGLLSLDDHEIECSRQLLFVVGGKVKNNHQKWTQDRKSTGKVNEGANWGEGPVQVQFIEFDAILFLNEQSQPKVWTINQFGNKEKELSVSEYQWNDGKIHKKWKFSSAYSSPSLSFLIERTF